MIKLIGGAILIAVLAAAAWYAGLIGQPASSCRTNAGSWCPSETASITWVGMAGRPVAIEFWEPFDTWKAADDPGLRQAQWSAYVERIPGHPVLAGCYASSDVGGPLTCHVVEGVAGRPGE